MKLTWQYWLKQAGIGLLFVLVFAGLGHLNYAQWRLLPGWTMADWWFALCWLCFPFAKWVVLEDSRDVQAPTIRRRTRAQRASDKTASVYENMAPKAREPRLTAAPKTALAWASGCGINIRGTIDFGRLSHVFATTQLDCTISFVIIMQK